MSNTRVIIVVVINLLLSTELFGEEWFDMKLSEHFTLGEFTCSKTAERCELVNKPSDRAIENMKYLCVKVLEPIRKHFEGREVAITSGFRNAELNKEVGGSEHSDHMCKGQSAAADIVIHGVKTEELFEFVINSKLPFKQCINEFGIWVHVSIERPLRQSFRAVRSGNSINYIPVNLGGVK